MKGTLSPRPKVTATQAAQIFVQNGGICHLCTRKIVGRWGEAWEADHVEARWKKGPDTLDNYKPAHIDCHAGKSKRETSERAKADRCAKNQAGVKPKRGGFRGWRNFKGEVIWND